MLSKLPQPFWVAQGFAIATIKNPAKQQLFHRGASAMAVSIPARNRGEAGGSCQVVIGVDSCVLFKAVAGPGATSHKPTIANRGVCL